MSPSLPPPSPESGTLAEAARRLDVADHLARLSDLLHLVAAAADGLPPPHGAAVARGAQIALDEVEVIRDLLGD